MNQITWEEYDNHGKIDIIAKESVLMGGRLGTNVSDFPELPQKTSELFQLVRMNYPTLQFSEFEVPIPDPNNGERRYAAELCMTDDDGIIGGMSLSHYLFKTSDQDVLANSPRFILSLPVSGDYEEFTREAIKEFWPNFTSIDSFYTLEGPILLITRSTLEGQTNIYGQDGVLSSLGLNLDDLGKKRICSNY